MLRDEKWRSFGQFLQLDRKLRHTISVRDDESVLPSAENLPIML
jgi:hypothetical protein